MALNKDILGQALYDVEVQYNDADIDDADLPAKRLEMNVKMAEVIINHFKANIKITIPGTGLTVGSTAVTGTSTTGTIQ